MGAADVLAELDTVTKYCTTNVAHQTFRLVVGFLDVLFEIFLIVKNDTACFTAVLVSF